MFAIYLHAETMLASRSTNSDRYIGYSIPYFKQVRARLESALAGYPSLALRQVDLSEYERVHSPSYLAALRMMASGKTPLIPPRLSGECKGYEHFLPGYCYSLGGLYEAIDQMRRGGLERAYCFSLGGHHAYADRGHGYCILHPIAAAARYAQSQGFKNILIVDWDLHHGDGTQSIFAYDGSVYCISIHSIGDLYMTVNRTLRDATTYAAHVVGHCNIPLLDEAFDDSFFEQMKLPGNYYRAPQSLTAFESALNALPFTPDLIFIHSGYDSHVDDQGKRITNWTNGDFAVMTRRVLEKAKACNAPVISVHGGGYTLDVTIAAAISHVNVLAN